MRRTYLSEAKSGLSESELDDLISVDDKMTSISISSLLCGEHITRLFGHLSEREAHGVNVMNCITHSSEILLENGTSGI